MGLTPKLVCLLEAKPKWYFDSHSNRDNDPNPKCEKKEETYHLSVLKLNGLNQLGEL